MGSSRLLPLTSGVGCLLSARALTRPSKPQRWIMEKARAFQKNIYFCFIDYAKAFDCVHHNKLWKILNSRCKRVPFLRQDEA